MKELPRMQIVDLGKLDVAALAMIFAHAAEQNRDVRLTVDGGVKVSVGQGMWTAPMGKVQA